MKHLLFCVAIVMAGTSLTFGQTSNKSTGGTKQDATARQIADIEQQWDRAILTADKAAMGRIMADDYTNYSDGGGAAMNKQAFIKSFDENNMPEGSKVNNEFSDVVQIRGKDMVVVTGHITQSITTGTETKASPKMRFTHVWVRRQGKWQIAGDQFIPAAAAASPASASAGGTQ